MLRNIRFYILLFSALVSGIVYVWVTSAFSDTTLQISRLTQIYALIAVAFLYAALIISPLFFVWKQFPYKEQINKSRRALGVSAFYFGLLHACFAFFGELGGFEGLGYLGNTYLIATLLSFNALIILYVLAITSFDFIIEKLTYKRWKTLQRFIYLAGVFILIHALMIGTHFATLSGYIPQIFFSLLGILLFLEALRIDEYLKKKFRNFPQLGITAGLALGVMVSFFIYSLLPTTNASPFSAHVSHTQPASGTQNAGMAMDMGMSTTMSQYPGMDGDKTKRYTTSFDAPESIQPQQDTKLSFTVYDAASGGRVEYYKNVYEKPSHLIIVNKSLNYFTHIHPEPTKDGFSITTQFPEAGEYHLYLSYQPFGAIEQQVAFTVRAGDGTGTEATQPLDTHLTKSFGDYQVQLETKPPYYAAELSSGAKKMVFRLSDKSGNPVTTLKPYLAAFGHLVMINQKTYEYLHVHPAGLTPPKPNEDGGPTVEFQPLGMYGQIKPGNYRVFAQFNPDGKLFTADFTVEVK